MLPRRMRSRNRQKIRYQYSNSITPVFTSAAFFGSGGPTDIITPLNGRTDRLLVRLDPAEHLQSMTLYSDLINPRCPAADITDPLHQKTRHNLERFQHLVAESNNDVCPASSHRIGVRHLRPDAPRSGFAWDVRLDCGRDPRSSSGHLAGFFRST